MAKVEIRGLSRRFDGAEGAALDGLDLDVEDGELLVLVGPSGCGKSTTLRLVAGLDVPDAGTIAIGGRDVVPLPPQDRDVAMVFQGYALYPHLSVRDNIGFPLKMRRVATDERARRVDDAAKMLGLSRLLDRKPAELSGGERQRVAMGRAIVRQPKAFLFDEPLSNLDAALRTELRIEIGSLVRRLGTTSLYVTHDQVEAMTMGDRIAVLRAGRLQQIGAPREVYERPANVFVAGFLGTPPINLLDLTVREGRLVGTDVALDCPSSPKLAGEVVLGVRPEHVAVVDGASGDFAVEVVTAEPLGPETIVHATVGGAAVRARAAGFATARPGDRVALRIDWAHVHWFDRASGLRIDAVGA